MVGLEATYTKLCRDCNIGALDHGLGVAASASIVPTYAMSSNIEGLNLVGRSVIGVSVGPTRRREQNQRVRFSFCFAFHRFLGLHSIRNTAPQCLEMLQLFVDNR